MVKRKKSPQPDKLRDVDRFALLLRSNMTEAEKALWKAIQKAQRYWTHKFKPQQVVHGYIPDFYCDTLKLAVEVDGKIHRNKHVRRNDSIRTRRLNRKGVTVIRFLNSDVFNNLNTVITELEIACE